MNFTMLSLRGKDAVRTLNEYRSRYLASGQYPFLIGDSEELERMQALTQEDEREPAAIIHASLDIKTTDWISRARKLAEEYEYTGDDLVGEWPGEILEKGSIGLHKEVLSGKIKPEILLGLAPIEKPWHLPAIIRFGDWNDCPKPEVHCAFHREWQDRFGAEITGVSADIIECVIERPPRDQETAMQLAWEQFWYCRDIVEQGCGSVSHLAATLLNSPYWYFWWD